jgi:hypothetical protein
MRYITVVDDTIYFHWQIELMLANFREVGINPNCIDVLFMHYYDSKSAEGLEIQRKNPDVRFFWYRDDREYRAYIPSKKPYGMYKHLLAHPNLNDEPIFYHDSDILFVKKIDEALLSSGDKWYTSNTDGYIGHDYVIGRGVEQYYKMCEIVGVNPDMIKHNDGGGAQYVMKNTTASYWLKVYEDSDKLWKFFEKQKADKKDNNLQLWTAEMWATLWVGYQFGFRIRNHEELKFCMGPNDIKDLETHKIYHNAGVTDAHKEKMFYKGEYISKYPYELRTTYEDNKYASQFYWESIKKYLQNGKV